MLGYLQALAPKARLPPASTPPWTFSASCQQFLPLSHSWCCGEPSYHTSWPWAYTCVSSSRVPTELLWAPRLRLLPQSEPRFINSFKPVPSLDVRFWVPLQTPTDHHTILTRSLELWSLAYMWVCRVCKNIKWHNFVQLGWAYNCSSDVISCLGFSHPAKLWYFRHKLLNKAHNSTLTTVSFTVFQCQLSIFRSADPLFKLFCQDSSIAQTQKSEWEVKLYLQVWMGRLCCFGPWSNSFTFSVDFYYHAIR